jgi:hypothetical protein
MGLLDVDIDKKVPITKERLLTLGFVKTRNGSWYYKNNRFNPDSNRWYAVIQYIPRGTYNGVRSRHSRLIFKDVNYEKLGKLYKNMVKHPEKRNSSGIVTPYQSQIVIKNPGLHDFELCVDTAKNSCKEFEKRIRYNQNLIDLV